ncbi:MAG: OmpA family protein [Bacteroidia bacterium]
MKQLNFILGILALFAFVPNIYSQSGCSTSGLQVGISTGVPLIQGEVRAVPRLGALSLTVEKPLSCRLSLRYQLVASDARGQDWRPSQVMNDSRFRNYRNLAIDQSLQAVVRLNPMTSTSRWYLSLGFGAIAYHTETDILDANSMLYSYEGFAGPTSFADRGQVLDALAELQDQFYETPLHGDPLAAGYRKDLKVSPSLITGLGLDLPLSSRVDLNLQYRISWHANAWLDGFNADRTGMATGKDIVHLPTVGLSVRLGKVTSCIPVEVEDAPEPLASAPQDAANQAQLEAIEVKLSKIETQISDQAASQKASEQALKADIKRLEEVKTAKSTMPDIQMGLFFETGKSEITVAHYPTLAQLSGYLEAYPDARVRIQGYADAAGDVEKNRLLSEKRASATAEFLAKTFGVNSERIDIEAMGEGVQAVEDTANAYQRRVQITLLR